MWNERYNYIPLLPHNLMKPEIERWWKQAEADYESAKSTITAQKYYVAAFLCQQAVEKALKALYIQEKKNLLKTHSVSRLSKELNIPENLAVKIALLEPIYQQTRYPDIADNIPSEEFEESDAQEALRTTEEVLEWTRKKLL